MPRLANCRNRPVSLDPKSMSIADLQALPKKSLILLASARNLVTTGTKPLLAQRVFEHERPPPTRNTNAGDDRNSDTRETSEDQHGRNSQRPTNRPQIQLSQMTSSISFIAWLLKLSFCNDRRLYLPQFPYFRLSVITSLQAARTIARTKVH